MAGKSGQVQYRRKPGTARAGIWMVMRILRSFTVPDLARTSGANEENCAKYVRALVRHGFVRKRPGFRGGRLGVYQSYMLVRNTGPDHPIMCDLCGRNLGYKCKED